METTYIFKRIERKNLVDEVTKKRLLQRMQDQLILDELRCRNGNLEILLAEKMEGADML